MFAIPNDDMVECPYNKHHRMARKRLQPHLIKCRLNYPDAELLKCPFNASHLIPEPEFTHHATNCPDRALITQYKYNTHTVKKEEEEDRQQVVVDCDENWDDTEADDYDPKKYASQANVVRAHIGSQPAERKRFRKEERKRLGDGDDSDEDVKPKDLDSKFQDDEKKREEKWFEDRSGSSIAMSKARREKSFDKSLDEWSKERGLPIARGNSRRRNFVKTEKDDGELPIKREREEEYPLDDDPYYSTRAHADRGSYLGPARGAKRRYN